MKKISVKTKITIWLTLLMALLAGLLLVFMLIISNSIATGTAMEQLTATVRSNVASVEVTEYQPVLNEDFTFYENGVTTLLYSKNATLLAGQLPISFTAEETFQNGLVRTVDAGKTSYLVLDMWVASGWDNGVWVRGLLEAPNNDALTRNLLLIALIALPAFIFLAALGSYRIAKRSFRPLDDITATAEAINEARDLSGRIGLPPGQDEFSRLAADFDQMFERLERSFEAEKQFTADASHELRTPVTIIKGACEYAEKYDETPDDHRETISMIHRQAEKMSHLISQLLSMTRIDQGTEKAHLERLNLGEFVNTFSREQQWDTSRLSVDVAPEIQVQADRELLGRLIRNLVENAFKYGKPDGKVWISVTANHKEALLAVRDNGIGISPEEQEKIWQRFYQVDPSRSGEAGAGLGLSMVKQIAKIHKGYMTLESVPEKGSIFTLHLPLLTKETSV